MGTPGARIQPKIRSHSCRGPGIDRECKLRVRAFFRIAPGIFGRWQLIIGSSVSVTDDSGAVLVQRKCAARCGLVHGDAAGETRLAMKEQTLQWALSRTSGRSGRASKEKRLP
jgi:hypothetical protein